jgi:uncharacterized protein YqhQ
MPTDTNNAEPASDARVHELEVAYAQGDFAHLRKLARALESDPSAPEPARASAREFRARVSVDVAVYGMLAFAFALFCAIVVRYALP